MNEPATRGGLARKLAKILGDIGKVPKSGHNAFHKYDYVTENDLVYAVRQKLSDAGIFVFSSVESQHVEIVKEESKSWALTSVVTKHTFVDGDSGEEFSVLSQGQGADNGDKGGYKAITGAMKYFLYKCFMIPTGDDPEADQRTDERAVASNPAQRTTAPATARTTDVPRDPDIAKIETLRKQFEGGKWKYVKIHFGKQEGKALNELDDKSLSWWITEWAPKPYQGAISAENLLLRAALDVADIEWK